MSSVRTKKKKRQKTNKKRHKQLSEGMNMSASLTVVTISRADAWVRTHQRVYIQHAHQLYLNNVVTMIRERPAPRGEQAADENIPLSTLAESYGDTVPLSRPGWGIR